MAKIEIRLQLAK